MSDVSFQDYTCADWSSYFRDHGQDLIHERDMLITAISRYYRALKSHRSFERPPSSHEAYISSVLEAANAGVAEEIKEHGAW